MKGYLHPSDFNRFNKNHLVNLLKLIILIFINLNKKYSYSFRLNQISGIKFLPKMVPKSREKLLSITLSLGDGYSLGRLFPSWIISGHVISGTGCLQVSFLRETKSPETDFHSENCLGIPCPTISICSCSIWTSNNSSFSHHFVMWHVYTIR